MKKTISLNGPWDFIADLDPRYHEDERPYRKHPYSLPEAERRHWTKTTIPGVWQKIGLRYDLFEGVCWYAREFDAGEAIGDSACIRFEGLNYFGSVFLNGYHLGDHEGGYTPFSLDTGVHLHPGINHIAVRVDNRAAGMKWPYVLGYFNYGGIHRDVTLEIQSGTWIKDSALSCFPLNGGGFTLQVLASAVVDGGPGNNTFTVSCNGETVSAALDDQGTGAAKLELSTVKPWSPEDPALYTVHIAIMKDGKIQDEENLSYGFRTIKIEDGAVHLNGTVYPLKGICYVYDSPQTGLAVTSVQIETDIGLMKEMGVNTVRCHYPMDKAFYDACDRAGLLTWIEPPVYCYHPGDNETNTAFSNHDWQNLAEKMITEMIGAAKNHPSVAIYGIGNECNTANPEATPFFRKLADRIRSIDPTRLVSYAALYSIVGTITEFVDVLGVNSYYGWYDKVLGGKGLIPEDKELNAKTGPAFEPINLNAMREMLDGIIKKAGSNLVLFAILKIQSIQFRTLEERRSIVI